MTQLFGDRVVIANATGCSSIYGGNLPTTPYTVNAGRAAGRRGRTRCSRTTPSSASACASRSTASREQARQLLTDLSGRVGDALVAALLDADQSTRSRHRGAARARRRAARRARRRSTRREAAAPARCSPTTWCKKSVWIVGGDGWAYDIGFGGLDHVLSTHRDVNVLVLDTEVYSNTGGQQSKATPLGAAAKFAVAGKEVGKKDLGMMAMMYGHVYVARIAFGARDLQTVNAFLEAESYPGPSLIIAYSHCIAHGYDLRFGAEQQKQAVDSGVWPLYRFDPRRIARGQPPLVLDSGAPKISPREYMRNETRFRMVEKRDPERFRRLMAMAEREAAQRIAVYQQIAGITVPQDGDERSESKARMPREDETRWTSRRPISASPAAPAHAGRLAAGRRPRHGAASRGRRRGGDRHALALRGADRDRGDGDARRTSIGTATRSAKRSRTSRRPRPSRSVPTTIWSRSAASRRRSACR